METNESSPVAVPDIILSGSTQSGRGSTQPPHQRRRDVMDIYSSSLKANYLAFVWGPGIVQAACSHIALLDRAEAIVFPVSGKSLVWFTFPFRIKVIHLT